MNVYLECQTYFIKMSRDLIFFCTGSRNVYAYVYFSNVEVYKFNLTVYFSFFFILNKIQRGKKGSFSKIHCNQQSTEEKSVHKGNRKLSLENGVGLVPHYQLALRHRDPTKNEKIQVLYRNLIKALKKI